MRLDADIETMARRLRPSLLLLNVETNGEGARMVLRGKERDPDGFARVALLTLSPFGTAEIAMLPLRIGPTLDGRIAPLPSGDPMNSGLRREIGAGVLALIEEPPALSIREFCYPTPRGALIGRRLVARKGIWRIERWIARARLADDQRAQRHRILERLPDELQSRFRDIEGLH